MTAWAPEQADYQRVFFEQNPWHQTGEVPSALSRQVERPLAQVLWKRLLADEPRRFQLILGPRRVGKTTVLYQTVRRLLATGVEPGKIWWLRLDHPLLLQVDLGSLVRAVTTAAEATAERPAYLMLDELVYARDWDLWLKTFHDDHWPVRIAATSSATAALRDRKVESGVGRWEEQHLTPYLLPEFLDMLLENLVAASMRSLAVLSGCRLHYWRDGSYEVDLIVDHHTEPLAFEIASSPNHSRAGLRALIERRPKFEGRAYLVAPQCPVARPEPNSAGIGTLPLDVLLLAVGAQAHQALIARVGNGFTRSAPRR